MTIREVVVAGQFEVELRASEQPDREPRDTEVFIDTEYTSRSTMARAGRFPGSMISSSLSLPTCE
jgi:hypothetical protein